MFRSIVATISVFSLIFPTQAFAIECIHPFSDMQGQFQLVERLKCNVLTTPVVLQITPVNVSATDASPYLSPGCDNVSTFINLYQGPDSIIDFSDTMASAHSDMLRVSRACDGVRLFRIERKPLLLTTPSGRKVNTSARIFAEDATLTLLGYVQTDEDTIKRLTIRDANDALMASAVKTLQEIKGDGTYCAQAIWTITNNANTELSATIVSFLLAFNDNVDFGCNPTQPPQTSGMSSVAAVAIGVALGGVLVIAGGIGAACYCMRNNPRYDKVKLIN